MVMQAPPPMRSAGAPPMGGQAGMGPAAPPPPGAGAGQPDPEQAKAAIMQAAQQLKQVADKYGVDLSGVFAGAPPAPAPMEAGAPAGASPPM